MEILGDQVQLRRQLLLCWELCFQAMVLLPFEECPVICELLLESFEFWFCQWLGQSHETYPRKAGGWGEDQL